MKTYFRILQYAESLRVFAFPYFLFSLLASLFGILNFTLLIPLLDVLFDKVQTVDLEKFSKKPEFSLESDYFKEIFNYYFYQIIDLYGRMGALKFACIAIIVSVVCSNIFRYLSQRILKTVEAQTIASLRQAIFEKTLNLHFGFFNNERKGNLMAHLTTDVQEVENSVGRAFTASFKEIFTLIMYFVFLFNMSVKLTLFSLLILPISGGVIATISRRLRRAARDVQERQSAMIGTLDEVFGGMRIVKGFNAEKVVAERFKVENYGYKAAVLRMVYRQEMTSPVSEALGVTVIAGILLYGGTLVINNDESLSASTFISFIILFSQVMRPAKVIADAFSGIQRGIASAERILKLIDTVPAIQDAKDAVDIPEFKEEIEFKNVSFEYQTGRKVLDNISFKIQKGKTVALVGTSGGGKSTLADLVPRFYDPTEGQILMDGIDLKHIRLASLSKQIGIVTQESILFNDSVANNITFGSVASQAQIEEAAKIANAHQYITQLADGYETFIGDRGGRLSGGQRQRLSIARAVLKNPPILILDEATSALDTESEKLVQEALTHLMKNRTTLVIAHRLSTIQHADEILVINHGKIVERGTHSELLENENGFYKKLNSMQET
ncbi:MULTISPECIES: ABC transporter transmembrane domain-containing protein [unclassified Arcicella]|uniref:ABC transporter ATP-binding protein n=1 Tax=unclassified Arcicella TaxID=2644986 RepID=UPI002864EBDC|nr:MULTISPECIES: ABC transporter transmembrane domain-containing protein [unclassified Arcicella]MDR6561399.1 subfamily B ATP-binding cassette protein MsbA [Arcicella sp. BE51]MDR6811283.1 subfamily B ATP-binding cassette protein MsbA [Arcicella sp. BE140]MDR6822633.1 subfamily B ATP-binding cassette protein MsbA [Arcicella sp. BE139]